MLPLKLSNLVIVHFFRFDAVSIKLCFLLWEIFLWWFLGVPLASMAKEDDGEDNGEDEKYTSCYAADYGSCYVAV